MTSLSSTTWGIRGEFCFDSAENTGVIGCNKYFYTRSASVTV